MSPGVKLPFRVRVPGSTSNLGPGFDTFAVALSLYLEVRVSRSAGRGLEWEGDWPARERNVFAEAFEVAGRELELGIPGLCFTAHNSIPLQRGLGSSAAAITGGLLAAHQLAGASLDTARFLQLAMPLEGHPDNLAAAWHGGWVLCWEEKAETHIQSLPIESPPLFVAAIPEIKVSTARAREVLPEAYSRADLVHTIQRSNLLLHALYRGERHLLAAALQDRVHQPYRIPLIPGAAEILQLHSLPQSAEPHHLGVYLSGSGSTLCSLSDDPRAAETIGGWMVEQFRQAGVAAAYRILQASPVGARVMEC